MVEPLNYNVMTTDTLWLVEDLQDRTQKASALAAAFSKIEVERLQYKPDASRWSVLECIAHLNRYYAFYMPLLRNAVAKSPIIKADFTFTSGLLGQFFVRLMEPKGNTVKKMKAMAKMNPQGSTLDVSELHDFMAYQEELLTLLETCKYHNLAQPKVPTALSKWITISLGDTLRFLVVHNERHLLQAQNCLKWAVDFNR